MDSTNFRAYLRNELVARVKSNPQYSLRAFASQLDLDASTLSKMLNGKRPIGKKTIVQLGAKLGIPSAQVARFINKPESKEGDLAFELLPLDEFAVIADWYHFAIMELMTVKGFKGSSAWIARTLGLQTVEVDMAVERLVRIGMLEITKSGKWVDRTSGFITNIGDGAVTSAHRKLQEQLLKKAIEVQELTKTEERDYSAMTMAIDSSKLPEAKEKIRRFRRSLTKFLTDGNKKDAVFNLSIALFPLTRLQQKGESHEN